MQFKRKVTYCWVGGILILSFYISTALVKRSLLSKVASHHKIVDINVRQIQNLTGLHTSQDEKYKRGIFMVSQKIIDINMNHTEGRIPLLTLFTTFKPAPDRIEIHRNVLKNWAAFQPFVKPLLYSTDTDPNLIDLAKSLGWEVLPCPEANGYGTPFLKAMYQKTIDSFPSLFYGYCNGDILFEYGLIDTLKAVLECKHELHKTFVIGQRTNFLVANRTVFDPKHVKHLQETEGSLFQTDAEDYFFMAHNNFPWDEIPNLVIGRMGYDNYFVSKALKVGFSLVDATETLLALHQTGVDGNHASHGSSKDNLYNHRLISEDLDISKGVTVLALYKTTWNNNKVEVWHRITKADPRFFKLNSKKVTELNYLNHS